MVKTPIIAAIGNFDGVHRGHLYLLEEAMKLAQNHGAQTGVVVFDPHPRRYFRPDDPPFLLTMLDQRDHLLKAAGADHVISLAFDKDLAALSPEEFVHDILADKLGLAGIVAGADFHFGKARAGDGAALQRLASDNGMVSKIVTLLEGGSAEKYGSTAIRDVLVRGDIERVTKMLGRHWCVSGPVIVGEQRGRTIGFPTANMMLGELIEPRYGVYATRVHVGDGVLPAVSNFGRRPTVGAKAPLLETHLLDFDGDLYGQDIKISFIDFIRDERKFDGLDALQAQIAADCERARKILF